jgi:hypothetical protein
LAGCLIDLDIRDCGYSISITKEDIESLIAATRIEAEAKKLGGAEKFFHPAVFAKSARPKPMKQRLSVFGFQVSVHRFSVAPETRHLKPARPID